VYHCFSTCQTGFHFEPTNERHLISHCQEECEQSSWIIKSSSYEFVNITRFVVFRRYSSYLGRKNQGTNSGLNNFPHQSKFDLFSVLKVFLRVPGKILCSPYLLLHTVTRQCKAERRTMICFRVPTQVINIIKLHIHIHTYCLLFWSILLQVRVAVLWRYTYILLYSYIIQLLLHSLPSTVVHPHTFLSYQLERPIIWTLINIIAAYRIMIIMIRHWHIDTSQRYHRPGGNL